MAHNSLTLSFFAGPLLAQPPGKKPWNRMNFSHLLKNVLSHMSIHCRKGVVKKVEILVGIHGPGSIKSSYRVRHIITWPSLSSASARRSDWFLSHRSPWSLHQPVARDQPPERMFPTPWRRNSHSQHCLLTGVSGGIYYEGIYMVKVILTEIYMLEYFLWRFLLQSAITMTK